MKVAAMAEAKAAGTSLSPFVFPGPDGNPLTDIKKSWASVCRRAGLVELVQKKGGDGKPVTDTTGKPVMASKPSVRLHDLRHSFASILVSGGASLPLIGQMLGHTQAQTTLRYAHLFDDPLRQAAEHVGNFVLAGQEAKDITPRD